jgi:hypothetical protein
MKALLGLLGDPCFHLAMIGVLLAQMTAGVAPDDDDRVAFDGPRASCPACKQAAVHLESCPSSAILVTTALLDD